jgi:hypothetical protein
MGLSENLVVNTTFSVRMLHLSTRRKDCMDSKVLPSKPSFTQLATASFVGCAVSTATPSIVTTVAEYALKLFA